CNQLLFVLLFSLLFPFHRKPSPVDMLRGTEVSLECEISGTPPFDVTWYKDRRQIRSSKKYKVTAKNYHTSIRILNVEAADVGEYQCKEALGDTASCCSKLTLLHPSILVLSMTLAQHCRFHMANVLSLSTCLFVLTETQFNLNVKSVARQRSGPCGTRTIRHSTQATGSTCLL
uniref:Ig-like domain-containing protein n=1 Tax=Anser brachyrhynchus TaxID=132585 RepID=A0A8B9I2K7_9AVES